MVSIVDIVLGAALASTVVLTVLSVLLAVQTILATRRMRTAATSSQPALGPYRVAGDGTIATVKCRVAVGFDPAKLAALTPEQRERVKAAIIDEAIWNVSSGEIAAEIRQKLDAVVADAKAGLARESEAAPQIIARTVVSPPGAPVRETVLTLSPAAARGLEVRGEIPGAEDRT